MQVFSLESVISLDSMGFSKGLDKAESKMKRFGKNLSNALDKAKKMMVAVFTGVMATQAVNAVRTLANETAAAGDKIDKQSQALGMSRKAYQQWAYILSQAGGSIDDMSVSMRTLNDAILNGGQEAEESLGLIGLSVKDLQNLSPEDALETVVRAFQKIPASTAKSAASVKLFGRSGTDLLPLLNSDIYTIDILRAKAEELGLVMSDDAVDASVEYSDALDDLQKTFTSLKYAIGAKILPPLTTAFTQITGYAGKIRKAYDNNGISGVFSMLKSDLLASIASLNRTIETEIWPSIQDFFRVNFGIDMPDWTTIQTTIDNGWKTIKDAVSKIISVVFGVLPPAWDAVKHALAGNWAGVKKDFANIFGVVFGVDPPTSWYDVKKALREWWKTVKDNFANVFSAVFGVEPPTSWYDIKKILKNWWTTVKDNFANVFSVVFGVDPPTSWFDVKQTLREWWKGVRSNFTNVFSTVFGVDPPESWEGVKKMISNGWDQIKRSIGSLFTVVFGVDPPDIDQLSKDFSVWWAETALPAIQGAMVWALTLFGMPTESAEEIASVVSGWWDTVVDTAQSVLNWVLHLPDSPHETGEELRKIILSWWNGVKSVAESALKWAIGIFDIGDFDGKETIKKISGWWDKFVKPFLKDALDFTLGLFGLPSIGQMTKSIIDWWENVKKNIANIFNVAFKIELPNWDSLKTSVAQGWAKVTGALGDWVASIDIHIPTWSEIADAWNQFWDDVYKNLPDWVKDFLGFFGLGSGAQKQEETAEQRLARLQKNIDDLNNELDAAAARAALIAQGTVPDEVAYAGGSGAVSGGGTPHAIMDLEGVGGGLHHINGFHASGLLNVPYDNYSALLHEGEMVLTKSQAREYRQGESNGAGEIVAAIQGLRNDMQNLKLVVGQKTFGKAVVEYGGNRMDGYIGRADSRLAAGYGS